MKFINIVIRAENRQEAIEKFIRSSSFDDFFINGTDFHKDNYTNIFCNICYKRYDRKIFVDHFKEFHGEELLTSRRKHFECNKYTCKKFITNLEDDKLIVMSEKQ